MNSLVSSKSITSSLAHSRPCRHTLRDPGPATREQYQEPQLAQAKSAIVSRIRQRPILPPSPGIQLLDRTWSRDSVLREGGSRISGQDAPRPSELTAAGAVPRLIQDAASRSAWLVATQLLYCDGRGSAYLMLTVLSQQLVSRPPRSVSRQRHVASHRIAGHRYGPLGPSRRGDWW